MTDWLSIFERGLKAVRYGIFQAPDNISLLLDGFCRAPELNCCPYALQERCPRPCECDEDPAASPQAAVVAPSPKQGSDSGPAEIDAFPRVPAGPPQTCKHCNERVELYAPGGGVNVWLHIGVDYQSAIACRTTYATPK